MGSGVTVDSLKIQLDTDAKNATGGLDALTKTLEKLNDSIRGVTKIGDKPSKSIEKFGIKALVSGVAIKKLARGIASAITLSNEYVENVNLFTVSMGEFAEEAGKYAEKVGEIMGVDPGEWMRAQGVFMTLATGFGVASDRAYTMSKNLTQLGYDLSSFFNISSEDAMQKLQSGISGELEPLRRLGYDLSQAKLEAVALSLGINKLVSDMTQAEKAQLRYYAIMTQVTTAQGDMARTLDAPANQVRVLKAQFTQAARAIGNIFIPALNAVLPYVIALFQVLRKVANAVAELFGYSMPEIDTSGIDSVTGSADDATSSLDDATDAAKKLKKHTMGFDELNIIDNSTSDELSSLGDALDFALPEYDFISGAVQNKVDGIVEKMEHLLPIVARIGGAIAAWKIGTSLLSNLDTLKSKMSNLKGVAGITLMIAGVSLEFDGAYDMGKDGANAKNILQTAIGGALGLVGSLITFGTGPVGWLVGVSMTLGVGIVGYSLGYSKRQIEQDFKKRWGELNLDLEDVLDISKYLTTNDLSISLSLYVDAKKNEASLKTQIEEALKTLEKNNLRINLGLAVDEDEYKLAVDNLVSSSNEYLSQKQLTANISVDILFGEDSETGSRLKNFSNEYYRGMSDKLLALGEELKKVVAKGFTNGKWIENYQEEAIRLQKEIAAMLEYISDIEYKAKLEAIKLDASETDMSFESFTSIVDDAKKVVEEQLSSLEGVRLEDIKVVQMEFDQNIVEGMAEEEAQSIYDKTVSEIQQKFAEGRAELIFGSYDFGLDKALENYKDEIEKVAPVMENSLKDVLRKSVNASPEEVAGNIENIGYYMAGALENMFDKAGLGKAARKTAAQTMEALLPLVTELEKTSATYLSAGQSVPESISKGLNNAMLLKAISDDADGINYILGQKFSTDAAYLEALLTAEGAGAEIDKRIAQGLLNNVSFVTDEASNTITFMNDALGEKTLEITPTLCENLKNMGLDITDSLYQGAEEGWEDIETWWDGLSLPKLKFKMPTFEWQMNGIETTGLLKKALEALNLPTTLPKLKVSWFAEGGFPTTGEMFVAREAGAEMVGRIGRRTAVVNNDQIVEGIASGVSVANSESNALLREQNSLLRSLLAKETGVYIDGKHISDSVDKYKRERGRVVVTGGAY